LVIFIVLIIGIYLLRILFTKQKFGSFSRKAYCILIGSFLFLISALRHYTVGVDIEWYVGNFYSISNTQSWSDVIEYGKDPGYWCFVKLISYITNDHQYQYQCLYTDIQMSPHLVFLHYYHLVIFILA